MNPKTKQKAFIPEIVLLCCSHCVQPGVVPGSAGTTCDGFQMKSTLLPCSSKVEVSYFLKILESGADGIEVLACEEKDCGFLSGSRKAAKRVAYVRDLLETIDFEPDRVGLTTVSGAGVETVMEQVKKRAEIVKGFGPNPMKAS